MFNNSSSELEDFKIKINLVHFAIENGYTPKTAFQPEKSFKSAIVLQKKSPTGNTTDSIIVRINPDNNHYLYFNPKNYLDKGSIIDFCSNKLNLNIGQTRKLLKSKFNLPHSSENFKIIPSPNIPQFVLESSFFNIRSLKSIKDYQYLTEKRLISKEIIDSPMFYPTIGIKTCVNNNKNVFDNTAFKIRDLSGRTIGLELKNNHFKGTLEHSNKAKGMWYSEAPANTSDLILAVTESPIDAISHFQLFSDKLTGPVKYLSSNGSLSDYHISFIQENITLHHPAQVLLLNDNANSGIRFNINLLGSLHNPSKLFPHKEVLPEDPVKIRCSYIKPFNHLIFTIYENQQYDHKIVMENFSDYFKKLNDDLFNSFENKHEEFQIIKYKQHSNFSQVTVQFDNRKELLENAMNITSDLRPNNLLKVQLPKLKDFNDDLIASIKNKVILGR